MTPPTRPVSAGLRKGGANLTCYGPDGEDVRNAPPTRMEPCPTCGIGKIAVFDVAAMKEERLRLGLTQADLANAAGWAPNQVAMLETGYRAMTADSAERYWKALTVAKRGKEARDEQDE